MISNKKKMDYGKMIKLLLPNHKFINIQISGDEKELKDLLSTMIESSPNKIKGIKDSEGNYFTLSSALNNFNILQKNDNIYYELILGKDKMNERINNISFSTDDKNLRNNNIILNNSPKVGNYYANYFINGKKMISLPENNLNNNNDIFFKKFSFDEIREINQQDLQLFSAYLLQFLASKLINEDMLIELNKMMNENNKELYQKFLLYKFGKISQENFLKNLFYFYENIKNSKSESTKLKKDIIKSLTDIEDENEYREKIYEKMKEYFYGENLNIIRLMIKYENESIMKAIKNFKINLDLNILIETFQKAIIRYKRKSIFQTQKIQINNFNNYKSFSHNKENEYLRSKERHNTSPQATIENEMNGIEMKKKMYHSKKSIKKISTHIQKYLEDKNKIVFDFIYNNNKDEYQSFRHIYIHNIKSENLGKELNDRCQKFIDREIINYGKKNNIKISNINIDILNKLIIENNFDVIKAYQNLTKHHSINQFCKELIFIIQNFKNNVNSDRYNYSDDENNNNENNNNKPLFFHYESNKEKIIQSFINDLNKLEITKKEIEHINSMINNKYTKINKIIEEYKKNKNILLYKDKIKEILKNKINSTFFSTFKIKDTPKKAFNDIIINTRNYEGKKTFSKTNNNFLIDKDLDNSIDKNNDNSILIFENNLSSLSLSKNKINFLKKKFTSKNKDLNLIYEKYKKNKNFKEFSESINLFLEKELKIEIKEENIKKNKKQNNNFPNKTPQAVKDSKDKLYWFIHPEIVKSKNVLNKQKEIISLLYREFCIDKNTYDIINKKIEGDDKGLISAFEVYAVNKDHNEFIETLRLIADLNENYKGCFYHLINLSNFNLSQKDKLISLYKERNETLFVILKNFDNNEDKDKALLEMKNLVKKTK